MTALLELGDIPFYWRVKRVPDEAPTDVPLRLPFAFSFRDDVQLVIQHRRPAVLANLERVYQEDANVGYLQDGHALAASYGGEFMAFFRRASERLGRPPRTAADIGCGGVYLLQRVRELGLSVKGIDPSPVTAAAGARAGIDIIPDFYPSPALRERFDVLFHYDVLEHVEDPVAFLRAHHDNLEPGGAVVFAVPDCSHHIALGDVSMVLHEHLNYFDQQSLERVVRAAGFEPVVLEAAQHGGVLLCFAQAATASGAIRPPADGSAKFERFRIRAQTAMERFSDDMRNPSAGEIGLYVPLRAFPYLGGLDSDARLRFFDDDPGLHGRYYDGFDVPVENRADLAIRAPERLLICSLAFGERIAQRVRPLVPGVMPIITWSSLFEEALP